MSRLLSLLEHLFDRTETEVEHEGASSTGSWDFLPPHIIEAVGLQLQPEDLQSARQVCRYWCQHVTTQVEACPEGSLHELDLHPDPQQWQGRLAAVEACLPRIHSAKVYGSSRIAGTITAEEIGMLTQLRHLKNLELNQELVPSSPTLGTLQEPPPPTLSHLTTLTRLALIDQRYPTARQLASLRPLASLRHSELRATSAGRGVMDDDCIDGLVGITQLHVLDLGGAGHAGGPLLQALQQMVHLKDLRLISLATSHIMPADLSSLLLPLTRLTHLSCTLTDRKPPPRDALPPPSPAASSGNWLLPPERSRLAPGSPGNPLLTISVIRSGADTNMMPLLHALSPNLQELCCEVSKAGLEPLLQLSPNLHPVSIWAKSTLPDGLVLDPTHHTTSAFPSIKMLTLLRPACPDPHPPGALCCLTHLGVRVIPDYSLDHPIASLAALVHLQTLDLGFSCDSMRVVPISALPPTLTSLSCNEIRIAFEGARFNRARWDWWQCQRQPQRGQQGPHQQQQQQQQQQQNTAAGPPGGCPCTAIQGAAASAPFLPQTPAWGGLPNLKRLFLSKMGSPSSLFVGGGLPHLLQGTPSLLSLSIQCRSEAALLDAARLPGCCPLLTHLRLQCAPGPALVADANMNHTCMWVQSLRHLRRLELLRDDLSTNMLAQGLTSLTRLHMARLHAGPVALAAALQPLPLADF